MWPPFRLESRKRPPYRLSNALALFALCILQIAAVICFVAGFFPYNSTINSIGSSNELDIDQLKGGSSLSTTDPQSNDANSVRLSDSPFNRIVFVLFDALRSDFMFGSHSPMLRVQELLNRECASNNRQSNTSNCTFGAALGFTVYASAPTVTLPRLKSITSGANPNFLDAVFNIAENNIPATDKGDLSGSRSDKSSQPDLASHNGSIDDSTWPELLQQLRGDIAFYGDDTWLRLFPQGTFKRNDGTTSFFVADFTEVDLNVTRHIDSELERTDWSGLFLHYLGADHIGHLDGPESPLMPPKLTEYDSLIAELFERIAEKDISEDRSTLLVVCGDHGMNSAGNHGGSSSGETSAALLLLAPSMAERNKNKNIKSSNQDWQDDLYEIPTHSHSSEYEYGQVVMQSDIASTISLLLGLPIPRRSAGVVIDTAARFFQAQDAMLAAVSANAIQLARLQGTYSPLISFCAQNAGQKDGLFASKRFKKCKKLLNQCKSSTGLKNLGEQQPNEPLNCLLLETLMSQDLQKIHKYCREVQKIVGRIDSTVNPKLLILSFLLLGISVLLNVRYSRPQVLSLLVSIVLGASFFASSLVEEEHQTWHFLTKPLVLFMAIANSENASFKAFFSSNSTKKLPRFRQILAKPPVKAIAALGILRIAQKWSGSGAKYINDPDTRGFLLEHPRIFIAVYLIASLSLIWLFTQPDSSSTELSTQKYKSNVSANTMQNVEENGKVYPELTYLDQIDQKNFRQRFTGHKLRLILCYVNLALFHMSLLVRNKPGFNKLMPILDASSYEFFFKSALMTALVTIQFEIWPKLGESRGRHTNIADRTKRISRILQILLLLQVQPVNVPLYVMYSTFARVLAVCNFSPGQIGLLNLLLSHTSFFCIGNSNSLGTVDLSLSYNGLSSYSIGRVGFLTYLTTFSGPLYWLLELLAQDYEHRNIRRQQIMTDITSAVSVHLSITSPLLLVSCFIMRDHLFIWSVFSPKVIYQLCWIAFYLTTLNAVNTASYTLSMLSASKDKIKTSY